MAIECCTTVVRKQTEDERNAQLAEVASVIAVGAIAGMIFKIVIN